MSQGSSLGGFAEVASAEDALPVSSNGDSTTASPLTTSPLTTSPPSAPPGTRRLARASRESLAPVEAGVDEQVRLLVESDNRRAAIDLLSRQYGDMVYSIAFRITQRRADADDVQQQTFFEALRDLDGFQRRASVRVWLLGIAHNRAIDVVRRNRREDGRRGDEEEAEDLEETTVPEVPTALDQRRRSRALEDCLRALNAKVRAALLMRFQHGLTYDQIGESSGELPGTLQARVSRAFPVLRRCLIAKGAEP